MKRNGISAILIIFVLCAIMVSCAKVPQETVEQFEKPQKREDITPTGKPEVIPAESQQSAEETDSVISPVTHPTKTEDYIVMECTGFQCCTHENPATAEYPLWSYENMNATIGNDVEKNVSAEFLGEVFTGEYKEMSPYISFNNYRVHEYENEVNYWFGVKENTGEILDLLIFPGNEIYPEELAGKSEAEMAEAVADRYIDRSEFELNKEVGYEGEIRYHYTREICGVRTCELLYVGICNGGISSFSANMIDEFAEAIEGKTEEEIRQEVEKMTGTEAIGKLEAELDHIFGDYNSYEITDKRLVVTEEGELGVIYLVRTDLGDAHFGGHCATGFLICKQ